MHAHIAIAELATYQVHPRRTIVRRLALVNHALGRKAESDAALARLVTESGRFWPYGVAVVHAYRGEHDQAFEWLEQAYTVDITAGQPTRPSGGPNLHDIYDSPAGTMSLRWGYRYTAPILAARSAGLDWTADNLDEYLKNPRAFLERFTGEQFAPNAPIMTFFVGGDSAEQERTRRDIVAYLRAIKDQPCS